MKNDCVVDARVKTMDVDWMGLDANCRKTSPHHTRQTTERATESEHRGEVPEPNTINPACVPFWVENFRRCSVERSRSKNGVKRTGSTRFVHTAADIAPPPAAVIVVVLCLSSHKEATNPKANTHTQSHNHTVTQSHNHFKARKTLH